jgi:sortase A
VTTLRPERPADGPLSYDTAQFAVVVGQLNDPLNDPLPGQQAPVVPDYVEPEVAEPVYPEPVFTQPAFAQPAVTGLELTAPFFIEQAFTEAPPPQSAVTEPAPVKPGPFEPFEPTGPPGPAGPSGPAGTVEPGPAPPEAPLLAPPPSDGGRAARRKAAARQSTAGGGHRARGRGGAAAPPAPAEEPTAPLSRMEARAAARAAKDTPGVVISRIVGELFITTGVLLLLFVTYQLWWTNVRAHQQADGAANNLQQRWDSTKDDPDRVPGTFSPGEGFAIMYIPKLDVKAPIAEGISKHRVLDKGMIGHYDGALDTAMPWDKTGNFGVAAHRNTHGEPFRYVNRLVAGDKVVVETADTYYTYEITSSLASTPPKNISVLRPVPTGSGFTRPGRYLTLTTCTPEFTSTNRLIVWGKLVEERPRSKGKPDALVEQR